MGRCRGQSLCLSFSTGLRSSLRILAIFTTLFLLSRTGSGQGVLVEAESFAQRGGWKLDTQFIHVMGSPYLLAHGLGKPVDDAVTSVTFPEPGEYHVFVRTKDWVARWEAEGTPGRFQLLVDGKELDVTFGTRGKEWFWHPGGKVRIDNTTVQLALHDMTGFDGRCDAIYFTKEKMAPPNIADVLPSWRRQRLGLAKHPTEMSGYDLVVVGGGYSGLGSALSAARMGCRVALIQDRGVLGGNGSSEVRVWSQGLIRRGRFPRIGEIVEEFCDHATKSPGKYEEFEDAKKEQIVRAEQNIDLFLNHFAYRVETSNNAIVAVEALDTQTSERKRFTGRLFADCTGHGTIGYLAGADWEMTPKGRMGMSNMWAWDEGTTPVPFPDTPWALPLTMADFPYPRDHHGQWFWEGGFDKDPIGEAEAIRDWNLRAVYGAFQAMKNGDGADKHQTAFLTWIAYVGGPRESRRLMGDVVLDQEDVVTKRDFPDGCVPSTWSIDLHYPKKQYAEKFPENPFISVAVHDRRIDRSYGYPVPYRCFYSRNIGNLFMAGRCISVTHEALGTTRVMKTCGMMGEVVGRAASICSRHDCLPRDVFAQHWDKMEELLRLPGVARRSTVVDPIEIPSDALPLAGKYGPMTGITPETLPGIVIDDVDAEKEGTWTEGTGLSGYVGWHYLYASPDSGATIEFLTTTPAAGRFAVRAAYQPHANRGTHVRIDVTVGDQRQRVVIDMTKPAPDGGFVTLGTYNLQSETPIAVKFLTDDSGGIVHADAVQVMAVDD